MNQAPRWHLGAVAGAVALVAGFVSLPAQALSLGRISVLSALGEPLRAEIDVAQITPEEAASLRATVATPEAFKAAGLEYTPLLVGLDVTLQRRADGRSYLRLSSSRPVSEPYVDLVLQASWSAGRLTRDYTMLFDPPVTRATAAAAPTAPVLSRPAAQVQAPARPSISSESAPVAPPATREARPAPPATANRRQPIAPPQAPREASAPAARSTNKLLTVKPGDTAGKIAAQNKSGTVSLDQMLVAMLRSNPNAFIGGNINRVRSGAVLSMPDADAAGAISAGEASQTLIAQSKDFNAFRRKLAGAVATTAIDTADRKAGGKVEAKVEDRAPATATPDKLTLSKGSVQAKSAAAAAEDAIAKNRQASDASARVAELSKNISDLNKLGVGPGAALSPTPAPAATASAAKVPGVALPTPAVVAATPALAAPAKVPAAAASQPTAVAATPPAAPVAPAGVAASAATTTASSSAASQPAGNAAKPPAVVAPKAAAPVAPAPETSFVDALLENPLTLPLGVGLLALLGGLGIFGYRKRKGPAPVDSSFLESRLQPDSFFGASGGQRIDTNEGSATGSSLVYSPSQLDAAGDVDPVAEADVYLAYGRDLQAEEILKEALRTTPSRVAVHAKLAEIYAKRRDGKSFEAIALEAFNLTQGRGAEWTHVTEMGSELDPANPLYQTGGALASDSKVASISAATSGASSFGTAGAASLAAVAGAASAAISSPSLTPSALPPSPALPALDIDLDLDLDLDFPLGDLQSGHTSPAPIAALATSKPVHAPAVGKLDMDFSDIPTKPSARPEPAPITQATAGSSLNGAGAKPVTAMLPAAALPNSGMLEFDLESLSLDLNGPSTQNSETFVAADEDPLHTKFLLAEEFRSLGDADGARSLAEEVLAEARGPLKVKAQAFLNALA